MLYEFKRQRGSHQIYKQEEFPGMPRDLAMMNFQSAGGQAKHYQVEQLLRAIEYIRENYPDLV